jgi:hypothetical protein
VTERAAWRAVLVGTAVHLDRSLTSLPQVADNLLDLAAALTTKPGLLPQGSVDLVQDPTAPDEVLNVIAAQPRTERLLFYYSGHGMRHERQRQLYLALPGSIDSHQHRERTGLPLSAVLSQLSVAPARQVIVILDCCFAGLATREIDAANAHLLMAVGETNKARYDGGRRNTMFTGALLQLLREGVPDEHQSIDLDLIYERLAVELGQVDFGALTPHQRAVDLSGRIALAANPACGTALTPRGIRMRARFAHQLGSVGRAREAAEQFERIAADANRVEAVAPADAFIYATQAAAWLAESDAAHIDTAIQRLEVLLNQDLSRCNPADVDDARTSLKHLRSRSSRSRAR